MVTNISSTTGSWSRKGNAIEKTGCSPLNHLPSGMVSTIRLDNPPSLTMEIEDCSHSFFLFCALAQRNGPSCSEVGGFGKMEVGWGWGNGLRLLWVAMGCESLGAVWSCWVGPGRCSS